MVDKLVNKLTNIDTIDNNLQEEINNISLNENVNTDFSNNGNINNDENFIITNQNNDTVETNCLALTVRKDYNLVIVKNIFTASGRISWKVLLSTAIINLLNLIF